MKNNILVTITGPSLTGKSTLANLMKPHGFDELVSTTTRPPRAGEINGIHYHFVETEKFQQFLSQNLMIEKVQVGNNYYGVSKMAFDDVIQLGKNGVAVVEPEGARQVSDYCSKNNITLHKVFINNPTSILIERFLQRYKNDDLAKDSVYAQRIIDMLTVEPKKWIEPAYNGQDYYDQVFDLFTPENQHEIVESIVNSVQKKLQPKKLRCS